MFILKKFQKQNSDQQQSCNVQQSVTARGVQPMDQYLQRKFSRGIQYNMKIIIRGDRNVGKTCLFYRLQGDKFHEEYLASEEIKVASIQWNYNATDDVVKVEIWDVVDKGKKRENLTTKGTISSTNTKDVLKMHNNPQQSSSSTTTNNQLENNTNEHSSPALDAEFVDVYKGTNGVIFLFDMTKAWTFDYVQREIHRCPLHIPILILANHRDMGHHRVITADQVQGFIDSLLQEDLELNRKRTSQIRYAESSMRNGFGLRYLYKFFNLPYLHLQRETMLKQLERNKCEISATCQELDAMANSDEYNYDSFLEMLTNKRRMVADQLSATAKSKNDTIGPPRSASMPSNMATMATINDSSNNKNSIETSRIVKPMPSIIIGANNPLPPKYQQQFQKKSPNKASSQLIASNNNAIQKVSLSSVKNIEDFIPDDGEQNMFRKFLDEPSLPQTDLPSVIDEDSDEDDTTSNNLVVAKYQEELDPEDMIVQELTSKSQIKSQTESNQIITDDSLVNDVIKGNNEIDSEQENNQDEKLTYMENSNVENEENHVENLPVLNCDDIKALENLYISKHSKQNGHDNNLSDDDDPVRSKELILTKGNKSNKSIQGQNGVMKKKKKSIKSNIKSNCDLITIQNGEAEPVIKKKKATKLKTKNNLRHSSKTFQDDIIKDDDRRQLEEFLGTDWNDTDDKRDHTSYQMF